MRVGLALIGLMSAVAATPVSAAEPLTLLVCGVHGTSAYIEPHETGPIYMFSVAVSGLELNSGDEVKELTIATEVVSDRHKLLGGALFNKAMSMKGGAMLMAPIDENRMVNLIFVAQKEGPFSAMLTGMTAHSKELWAEMKGICSVSVSEDRKIPSDFFNSLYPKIEAEASRTFSERMAQQSEGK
ncbi:MAG: hypothetical protein R3E18_06105 [Sphingomonadaceae bacterium]